MPLLLCCTIRATELILVLTTSNFSVVYTIVYSLVSFPYTVKFLVTVKSPVRVILLVSKVFDTELNVSPVEVVVEPLPFPIIS